MKPTSCVVCRGTLQAEPSIVFIALGGSRLDHVVLLIAILYYFYKYSTEYRKGVSIQAADSKKLPVPR